MEKRLYETPETEAVELITESFICGSDDISGGGGTDHITPGGDD